jgi:exosortase
LLVTGAFLTFAGVALDWTMVLALAWCTFALAFCAACTEGFPSRLLLLPFFGFPWVAQCAEAIGWWFRYTGAVVTGVTFSTLGFSVQREGTLLLVQGMPLSVEPACAGLNVLQAMLLAGVIVLFLKVPAGRFFWIGAASLPALAWLANTVRIFLLGLAGLSFGPQFAMGWFHNFGGWLVLCLMFALCQAVMTCLGRFLRRGYDENSNP